MREYTITKLTSNHIDWTIVPKLNIDNHQWLEKTDISATAQICCDDTAIYVKLTAYEKNILSRYSTQCDPVWNDSCLEFFFCPIEGDLRYFDFETNPNGASFIGFGKSNTEMLRLIKTDPCEKLLNIQTDVFDGGWSALFTIPYDFIRIIVPEFAPVSGSKIRANCYKCGDETVSPHYISWNPINFETPLFHRPQDFGTMIFE
ncbi:MAG: hypothetical protein IJO48_06455 [Clostridia bacterium]|nr:hypothetical protein [Clostridia bacterium]